MSTKINVQKQISMLTPSTILIAVFHLKVPDVYNGHAKSTDSYLYLAVWPSAIFNGYATPISGTRVSKLFPNFPVVNTTSEGVHVQCLPQKLVFTIIPIAREGRDSHRCRPCWEGHRHNTSVLWSHSGSISQCGRKHHQKLCPFSCKHRPFTQWPSVMTWNPTPF